jgi:putative MATE family efflux protein
MSSSLAKRYIGTKEFYRRILAIAIPIMVQNFITNFVNMLDNIMVGQMGTAQMSGVSITNQIISVLTLCIFGAVSGIGLFTAQFAGSKDHEGIKYTMRVKVIVAMTLVFAAICIFVSFGNNLIGKFLEGDGTAEEIAEYLSYGRAYMLMMLPGLIPFGLSQAYNGTLREQGKTIIPMMSGLAAVFINLGLNWVLIFGHLGAPAMGVRGAALATTISRYCEFSIVAIYTHTHTKDLPFAKGLYKSLYVPKALLINIAKKATPLLCNESLFSLGTTIVNQSYSVRGLEVMAAISMANTIAQLLRVTSVAIGNAVGITMGQMLGAEEPRDKIITANRQATALGIAISVCVGVIMASISKAFPNFYNTTDSVKALATTFILIQAVMQPILTYANCAYYTLRSGGKTVITMLFDCCYIWTIMVPLAYFLSRYTDISIRWLYFICQGSQIVKASVGAVLVKKGVWIQNIIKNS